MNNPNQPLNIQEAPVDDGNPWGKSFQENVPPFKGERDDSDGPESSAENEKTGTNNDEYFIGDDGEEYRNLERIDISTEEGKYDYLTGYIDNYMTRCETQLTEAKEWGIDNEVRDAEAELQKAQRWQRILQNIDISSGRSVMDELERQRQASYKIWTETPNATQEAKDQAEMSCFAAGDLIYNLGQEMADRDPAYFGIDDIEARLDTNIKNMEKKVEDTKVDGWVDENGRVYSVAEGQKMPSNMTPEVEMDLKEAQEDSEVFKNLVEDYQKEHNYQAPNWVNKIDFRSRIEQEVLSLTQDINQTKRNLETAKENDLQDHDGYQPLDEHRKWCVNRRRTLRRILEQYFL